MGRSMKRMMGWAVLLALVMLAASLSLSAQEAPGTTPTAEPGMGPIVEPVTPGEFLSPGEVVITTTEIIVGLIAAAGVGIGAGFGGLLLVVRQIRDNDLLKYNLELLYNSAPVKTREQIREVVKLLDETGDLADELTDGTLPPKPEDMVGGTA